MPRAQLGIRRDVRRMGGLCLAGAWSALRLNTERQLLGSGPFAS